MGTSIPLEVSSTYVTDWISRTLHDMGLLGPVKVVERTLRLCTVAVSRTSTTKIVVDSGLVLKALFSTRRAVLRPKTKGFSTSTQRLEVGSRETTRIRSLAHTSTCTPLVSGSAVENGTGGSGRTAIGEAVINSVDPSEVLIGPNGYSLLFTVVAGPLVILLALSTICGEGWVPILSRSSTEVALPWVALP